MTLPEFFVKQKVAGRKRTEEVLALLRQEQLDWRPAKGALSIGEMLRHLWVSEEGTRKAALEGDFTYYEKRVPGGLAAVLGAPPRSLGEELRLIKRVHEETLAAVRKLPEAAWDEERVHAGLGFRRKVAVMLFSINEHEVHHRAQLMTYLRILGTPAPEPFAKR